MGKKLKLGKSRKDKFYFLAKETGLRARSAFKLIQLNRKYGFLQESRVLVDLCAAPGGWLQVASQNMPESSLILGVDLVPIKAIKNVITMVNDITTDKCVQDLKKEMQTWKADCVLHDGAPNVGVSWSQDAFSQAHLTLSALKIASELLRPGGWFVTKVFRSKDHPSLVRVFSQLFKKVHVTKPQASRLESAEIFVVCEGFIATKKLDSQLLNPKQVFMEDKADRKMSVKHILHPEKHFRSREGYAEGDELFSSLDASAFVSSDSPVELLARCNEIAINDERFMNSKHTTEEIKLCCRDIKVLGLKEIKNILSWRQKLRKEFAPEQEKKDEEMESEDEMDKIERLIRSAKRDEKSALKRQRKKLVTQEKRKQQREDMDMNSQFVGHETSGKADLFSLATIFDRKDLSMVQKSVDPSVLDNVSSDESIENMSGDEACVDEAESDPYTFDNDDLYRKKGKKKRFEVDEKDTVVDDLKRRKMNSKEQKSKNPLLVRLDDSKTQATVENWFSKDVFKSIGTDDVEDYDVEEMLLRPKNGQPDQEKSKVQGKQVSFEDRSSESDCDSYISSEDDDRSVAQKPKAAGSAAPAAEKHQQEKPVRKLTPECLALGTKMVMSFKDKKMIEDEAYNRYSYGEENLPVWFAEDEQMHIIRHLPVTKEEVSLYRRKMRELNAAPSKKVAEAKARRKQKVMKIVQKARKKLDNMDQDEIADKEKLQQVKSLYKKANLVVKDQRKKHYVVAKKGLAGKKYRRPRGVKGEYKVVDPRMKKDVRSRARASMRSEGKKGQRSKKPPPKRGRKSNAR